MKKNIKLKNKILALCATLLVFSLSFLPIFGYGSTTVRADDVVNPIISGNIFIVAGDGSFSPLVGDNGSVTFQVFDGSNNTFINSCPIDKNGQFLVEIPNYSGSATLICRIADKDANIKYFYMFNDVTNSQTFGPLTNKVTFFNCYFRYFPIRRDLQSNVYNYVYNTIQCDTRGDTLVNSRLLTPGKITDYYNALEFSYTLKFNSKYGTYPACWLNVNDNSNTFVAGLGVIGAYTAGNSYPWKFYLKDNVGGNKLLIAQFENSDFPNFEINLKLRTYKKGNFVYIDYYYATSNIDCLWILFKRVMLTKNAFINSITLQPSACSCTLTYSLNYDLIEPAPVNLTYAKQLGYDEGFTAGQEYGYNVGYNAGVEANKYSFWDLTSAVIDVPVKTLTDLFDVEILGVNMKSFIFSIATVIIVLVVVRIWLGSRGV